MNATEETKLVKGKWYRHKSRDHRFSFGHVIGKYTGESGAGWPCFDLPKGRKAMVNLIHACFEEVESDHPELLEVK